MKIAKPVVCRVLVTSLMAILLGLFRHYYITQTYGFPQISMHNSFVNRNGEKKKEKTHWKKIKFRCRDLNPGLSGESRIS